MHMEKEDYLKKALLDTQERVRDYMNYSKETNDKKLQSLFKEHAEIEGEHAKRLQDFIDKLKN